MMNSREAVATILYGGGAYRRFTQDGPILPDVWVKFFEAPGGRIPLLIEPWLDRSPAEVATRLRDAPRPGRLADMRIVFNRTTVSCAAALGDVVEFLLPCAAWYAQLGGDRGATKSGQTGKPGATIAPRRLPSADQMWGDVTRSPDVNAYEFPALLAIIRVVGLICYAMVERAKEAGKRRKALERELDALRNSDGGPDAEKTRRKLAQWVLAGWTQCELELPAAVPDAPIFSIGVDRVATLALTYSIKTVKADAATRLFSVDCRALTWAVIDSGVDATHPAFLDRDETPQTPRDPAERLRLSRVRETYDFTRLRGLLLGESDSADVNEEIVKRINRSQAIDWETLKPFLRVPHDASYAERLPKDTHGTHVAGILAANWLGEGEPLRGMCPNIRLIDIRVCKDDGTGDEFTVMSALQFVRHLNSHADRPYIHGVNMSLSLQHNVATYACGQTPICLEAERAVSSGLVVVAAAGNGGYQRVSDGGANTFEVYSSTSITDPGNAESVITVGSTHRIEPHTYGVSYFSSRGPTGDGRNKPDLLAPGEKILAPAIDGKTTRLDGTSMAAPHVSGAAAMLMARHVELIGNPARIKKILCSTATDLGRERYFQGCGLVDVLRAMQSV